MGKMRECFKLSIMGCLPSRQGDRDERQDTSNDTNASSPMGKAGSKRLSNTAEEVKTHDKSTFTPTIQMVNEDTLKLLQEIGELKVFQTANNADHKKNIDLHQDIILALENPTKAICTVTSLPNATSSNVK